MENNTSKSVTLHEFVKLCREKRVYKINQTPYLEHLALYIKDSKVYKIVLQAYRETLSRSKKVGLNSWFTIITENIPENPIISPRDMKLDGKDIPCDISKGLFVLYYSFRTREFKIYAGDR